MLESLPPDFLAAFAVVGLLSAVALFFRALKPLAALVSFAMGLASILVGGWPWFFVLAFFFLSSSILSFLAPKKKEFQKLKYEKEGPRDYFQVLANGTAPILLLLIHFFKPMDFLFFAFCASIAAVTSDTWSTEVGALSSKDPIMITTGRRVERGTSGGVSVLGLFAGLLGALSVALLCFLFSSDALFSSAVFVFGFLGGVFDSLLGATIQAEYSCPVCGKRTERFVHSCGTRTELAKGVSFIDNDIVNLFSGIFSALCFIAFFVILHHL